MEKEDPLLNHVILETIFKNLDTPDLKTVRLVSSLWKDVSLDAWRSTAVLVLTPHGCEEGDQLTFSEFREMIQNDGDDDEYEYAHLKLGRKPFSRYKLVNWAVLDGKESEAELGLFREHGPLMEYLHLEDCDFIWFSDFEHVLTRNLPNLEKLVWSMDTDATGTPNYRTVLDHYIVTEDRQIIEDEDADETIFKYFHERHNSRENFQRSCKVLEIYYTSPSGEVGGWRCETWTKILYCFPAIEEITVRMHESDIVENHHSGGVREILMSPFLNALKLVTRLHGGSSKIRKLDIMNFYRDANYVFGGGFGFSPADKILDLPLLEELYLDWGSCSGEEYSKQVLENVSDTLQELDAYRAPEYKPLTLLPLPRSMDSLGELYLWGNVTENLSFLRFTPALKVLDMSQFELRHKLERILLAKSRRRYIRFCTTDLVSNTEKVLLRHKIPEASLVVSSLEYFHVDYPVSAAGVPKLAKWLPNVKTVKMVMDNNEVLSATCKAWPKLEEIECLYSSKVDDGGVSSLIQCSELQSFKMTSLCGQATLTCSSIDQFLKIASLRELDISILDKVSEEAEAKLLEKLSVVNLIRNDHSISNDAGYECCEQTPSLQKVFGLVKPLSKTRGSSDVPAIVGPLGPRALRSGRILRSKL